MIPSPFVDVIVIGAGLSGFQAAVGLDKAGLSYVVLEANDRVGGKTLSVPASPKSDGLTDLGAAWINDSYQKEIRTELRMPFHIFTDEQLAEILAAMTSCKNTLIDPTWNILSPDAAKLDSKTALEFASKKFDEGIAEVLVTMLAQDLLGVEADELSALFLINYIKSGTGLANISSDSKDGGQYLRTRQDRLFEPHLPPAKKDLARSAEIGYYSKSILVFDEPWWRNTNLCGVLMSMDDPISFTRDTRVPEDKQYSITCFHVGQPGRKWSRLPEQERKDTVVKQLNDAFGTLVERVPASINIIEKDWFKDPRFLGGPSPVMKPRLLTGAGNSISDPFKNIYFIGTETSVVWKGYMEGTIRSGIRGAREVTEALSRLAYL
ncbi:flavin-containing protein [Fusarium coicis]|nr:flavin-containing protein [Fusarium coicis]